VRYCHEKNVSAEPAQTRPDARVSQENVNKAGQSGHKQTQSQRKKAAVSSLKGVGREECLSY